MPKKKQREESPSSSHPGETLSTGNESPGASRAQPREDSGERPDTDRSGASTDGSGAESSTDPQPERKEDDDGRRPVVVAVGASAGGLDVFKRLLASAPTDAGLAIVLIQHLDPTHESMMVELLSRDSALPVVQPQDGVVLEPDRVYMIPPNKFMTIRDGRLHLEKPLTVRGIRLPIDHFFRSLAEDRKEKSICMVLSGTGSDGSNGIRHVKAEGGMTLAQKPDQAQYDGMPTAAISTGAVDYVLPVEDMWQVVLSYARHPYVREPREMTMADRAPDHFRAILGLVRAHTDHDFSRYKPGTVTRRIERRMGVRHVDAPAEYLKLLRADQDEVQALFRDMLIGVTGFFRDPDAWEDLRTVVAKAVAEKGQDEAFRVWVPGCSTGEEAYSIALALHDIERTLGHRIDIQVFATDIDERAVDIGRLGLYPESVTRDVPADLLELAFTREGDRLRVRKRVREGVVFAAQNLLSDPPFSHLDLVSCRNLLIYLQPEVQESVLELFHFALRPGGLLFLGSSESPTKRRDLFDAVSQSSRIFRKRGVSGRRTALPSVDGSLARGPALRPRSPAPTLGVAERSKNLLLEAFAPASVVVSARGVIEFIHGPVRNYLDFPSGEPELDIHSMALHGLKAKIRSVLDQVQGSREPVTLKAPRVRRDGQHVSVVIQARPLPVSDQSRPLYLVSFFDDGHPTPAGVPEPDDDDAGEPDTEGRSEKELALELHATRQDLQSTIEELESANEELKASNEEVMSMNEELQSANEELETSKEELQSLNEELSTVNSQLHDKVDELESTRADLTNFLTSTDVATLFLDSDLRIRRFTPATVGLMNVIPSDVGRPITDISARVDDPTLADDAREVLDKLSPLETQIAPAGGSHFMRRITPFRTEQDHIEGVVVTYTDVTRLKRYSERVELRERQQAVTAQLGRAALASTDLDELLERAARDVALTLSMEFAKIMRYEPEAGVLRLVAGFGWADDPVGRTVRIGSSSQSGYALETRGSVITPDVDSEGRFRTSDFLRSHGVKCGLTVIIGPESDPWGVLGVHASKKLEFTRDDTNFATSIANVVWEAIRREEAEDRIREQLDVIDGIYRSAPIGLAFLDRDLRFVRLNDHLAAMNAVDRDEHLGRTLREVAPQMADQLEPLFESIIESGEPVLQVEVDGPDPENPDEELTWLASYVPILSGGRVAGINAAVVDVTERRQAERALEEARKQADAANHAKTRFLANMSHEIRSPLTAILGFSRLLKPDVGSARGRSILNLIRQNGQVLQQMVDDILDLSKIEADSLPTNITTCVLADVFAYIRSMMSVRARSKSLTLNIEFDGPVPESIDTDPRMLRQILLNLVGNGIKFTQEGGVRVVVRCDAEDESLEIDVVDSGPGIAADQLERIFDPFTQVDTSATRTEGGTGLGLPITRRLLELLGGAIDVHSKPGEGSTFSIRLPTGPLEGVPLVELDGSNLQFQIGAKEGEKLPDLTGRILAVEDRGDIRLLIKELLEAAGAEVVTAADGAEALEMWRATTVGDNPVDLVVMDIQMPLMDGIEATKKLREEGFTGPIVALTAGVMSEERSFALEAGCDDFITKPLEPADFVETLRRWINGDRSGGRLSILMVEDHADVTWVQTKLFEKMGHHVTAVSTGESALELLGEVEPDVVFVDLGLPGMSGRQLAKKLRDRPDLDGALLVCLSGRREDEVDWQSVGFDRFLRKPITEQDLLEIFDMASAGRAGS